MAILTLMSFIFAAILYTAWKKYVKSGRIYKSTVSLSGKTVLITGGSSGIGKQVAIGLAKRHARVIIVSRDAKKGKNAMHEIEENSGNKNVTFMKLDLSDCLEIEEFVKRFRTTEHRLDILVNGAGIISSQRTKDCEHGLMFAANVLGPFLLTNLLLPLLERTAALGSPSRIVNIASDAYLIADIDLMNIDPYFDEKSSNLSILGYYATTKLMTIYLNSECSRLLKFRNVSMVTTYALHPGTAQSKLGNDFSANKPILKVLRYFIMTLLAKSPYFCAQGILYCCLEPGIEEHSGKYFSDCRVATLFPHAKKEGVGKKLWMQLDKLSGLS